MHAHQQISTNINTYQRIPISINTYIRKYPQAINVPWTMNKMSEYQPIQLSKHQQISDEDAQ